MQNRAATKLAESTSWKLLSFPIMSQQDFLTLELWETPSHLEILMVDYLPHSCDEAFRTARFQYTFKLSMKAVLVSFLEKRDTHQILKYLKVLSEGAENLRFLRQMLQKPSNRKLVFLEDLLEKNPCDLPARLRRFSLILSQDPKVALTDLRYIVKEKNFSSHTAHCLYYTFKHYAASSANAFPTRFKSILGEVLLQLNFPQLKYQLKSIAHVHPEIMQTIGTYFLNTYFNKPAGLPDNFSSVLTHVLSRALYAADCNLGKKFVSESKMAKDSDLKIPDNACEISIWNERFAAAIFKHYTETLSLQSLVKDCMQDFSIFATVLDRLTPGNTLEVKLNSATDIDIYHNIFRKLQTWQQEATCQILFEKSTTVRDLVNFECKNNKVLKSHGSTLQMYQNVALSKLAPPLLIAIFVILKKLPPETFAYLPKATTLAGMRFFVRRNPNFQCTETLLRTNHLSIEDLCNKMSR